MNVVIAVDKFKGSLTGEQVALALAAGIRGSRPTARVTLAPVADGGDGTVAAAISAGFTEIKVTASGPTGLPVSTSYARSAHTAVLELADVCGQQRLPYGQLQPWASSTFGLGELIQHAIHHGVKRVVVGLGGSASTDGGVGLLQALGADVRDAHGGCVRPGAAGLAAIRHLDLGAAAKLLADIDLVVACDVENPLLGATGAAAVYGPQKGLSPADVAAADAGLMNWSEVVRTATGIDRSDHPGAGAAGGAAFGLMSVGGRLAPGGDLILELIGFDGLLLDADLVLTGEGSLDRQSLSGKIPVRVAARAVAARLPVVAVVGRCSLPQDLVSAAGFAAVYALSDLEPDLARSKARARELLTHVGRQIAIEWTT